MKRFLATLLLLFVLALPASAQGTIVCVCPSMPILKQGIGRWEAQKIVSVAVVQLPDNGETLNFAAFTIQKTPVLGVLRRAVQPCEISGVATEDGSVMTLQLPREPVVLRGFTPTALAMTAVGTLTRPSGKIYSVVLNYPDCPTSPIRGSFGRARLAHALTATGTVTLP